MEEIMLKIDNVSKMYKLGQIGGTTLKDEMQRLGAKIRHQEDPTKRIGAKDYNKGESFMALNGVSFEVKKGERVGIIGHNGAGKSTLLKLISRVTAPTNGTISMNGRVASMLEVGTGFHGELTGRENIYMNGAILGMTKKEIDAKMEDIIEFSECRQFIDTPVKRYSSGMYVKLAFSVAAHLDSEIMIMDEVLAVGDMAFQKKCLDKMNDVSRKDGRTILYVSHNMNTIRQLCDRCIVLDHGKIVFDGAVNEAIQVYLGNKIILEQVKTYQKRDHAAWCGTVLWVKSIEVLNPIYSITTGDTLKLKIDYHSDVEYKGVMTRIVVLDEKSDIVGMSISNKDVDVSQDEDSTILLSMSLQNLAASTYSAHISFFALNQYGSHEYLSVINNFMSFVVNDKPDMNNGMTWDVHSWGHTIFPSLEMSKEL